MPRERYKSNYKLHFINFFNQDFSPSKFLMEKQNLVIIESYQHSQRKLVKSLLIMQALKTVYWKVNLNEVLIKYYFQPFLLNLASKINELFHAVKIFRGHLYLYLYKNFHLKDTCLFFFQILLSPPVGESKRAQQA